MQHDSRDDQLFPGLPKGNAITLLGDDHERVRRLLGEAIELSAESELVLRTLGEHMFNRFIEIKRQEWEDYRVQVTQWELDRYLPVL